jgi:hypothetical protein
MKTLAIAVLLVACGDGSSVTDAHLVRIDAFMPDAPCIAACNPADPWHGCGRCTYIHRADGRFPHCYETCTADLGTIPLGGACTPNVGGVDDCVAGTVCRVDTCVPVCSYNTFSCTAGFCPRDESVCFASCDPTAPSCPPDEQCTLSQMTGEGPGCAPIGDGPEGAACTFPEECGGGLACVVAGSARRCVPMCLVAGPPCATGTCTPINVGEPYGVCL